jgi:hypothetical protein
MYYLGIHLERLKQTKEKPSRSCGRSLKCVFPKYKSHEQNHHINLLAGYDVQGSKWRRYFYTSPYTIDSPIDCLAKSPELGSQLILYLVPFPSKYFKTMLC